MRVWVENALELLEREPRVAMVAVVAIAGSAPRDAGAKMLVTPTGAYGTIGGGALEHTCIAQARAMLARAHEHARAQDYPLGPLLGQCCGGRVRVALDILTPADRSWLAEAAACETRGQRYRLTMALNGSDRRVVSGWPDDIAEPHVALLDGDGMALFADDRRAWSAREEYAKPVLRPVMLIGGGHVGFALASMLRQLPVRLTWIDPRPAEDGGEAGMGGAALSNDPVGDAMAALPGTAFLVMTHSHALDFDLAAAILRRQDAIYCGVIGSKTKRQRFLGRLARLGLTEQQLAGMTCPIGAVGLVSKEPSVIALSVATEIMLRFEAHEKVA